MYQVSRAHELLFAIILLISVLILPIAMLKGFLPVVSYAVVFYGHFVYLQNHKQQEQTLESQQGTSSIHHSTEQNQSKNNYSSPKSPDAEEVTLLMKGQIPTATTNITRTNANGAAYNIHENMGAIITFGDAWKSQFTTAKPILDKYGIKASYYVPCNFPGKSGLYMTWQDIAALQNDGMDIESKGMNDIILTNLPASKLNFEIGLSKQCLTAHRFTNAKIFATPHGKGSDNATVVDQIAKYYDFAVNGFSDLMFLHCDGWKKYSPDQTDCRTFDNRGKLTYANRYVIREWSHNARDIANGYNGSKTFQEFVTEVDSQIPYNEGGKKIDAIPILAYHRIDNEKTRLSTPVDLFDKEMKYLHDNGVIVITMSNLAYDERTNYFYLIPNS